MIEYLIDKEVKWRADPTGKPGYSRVYADGLIRIILMLKDAHHMSLRTAADFMEAAARSKGLDWEIPHPSTISRRETDLEVEMPPIEGDEPLKPPVDGTGLKHAGDGEWTRKTHGPEKRSGHLEFHMIVDANTLMIRSLELTKSIVGTPRSHPRLLTKFPPKERSPASQPMGHTMPSSAARR